MNTNVFLYNLLVCYSHVFETITLCFYVLSIVKPSYKKSVVTIQLYVKDSEKEEEIVEEVKKKKNKKKRLAISDANFCEVCQKYGHEGGFQGATFIYCPMRPCFLCKLPGDKLSLVDPLPRLYGLDIHSENGLILVSDNFGFLYICMIQCEANKWKLWFSCSLHCNPVEPDVLLSCGNDHYARLWDIRWLKAGSSFADLSHSRVVNSAYFSPHTGTKILTTSQDNRIRVWDSIYGNMESPSREIVHSQDFNRHLTAFRAEWDPKDTTESLAVIGRYISENYNGVALHPKYDVLASGSSRSLYIWRPKDKSEAVQSDEKKTVITRGQGEKSKKKFGGESDDSDDESFSAKKGNMSKTKSVACIKAKTR